MSPLPAYTVRTEMSALWRLSWPMLAGQLATVGMGVADVAMTGHVSAAELAAVSLGSSVWSIILVTVMGVMMAINTVVAHETGAAQFDRIAHVVRQALWKGLGVGLAACALTNVSTLLFDHIGLAPAVNANASMFLHVISLGMPQFPNTSSQLTNTLKSSPRKAITMIGTVWLMLVV